MKNIAVVGFGKIGQALAANMLRHADDVLVHAIDTNKELIQAFQTEDWHTHEPGVQDILQEAQQKKRLIAGSDYASIQQCQAVIIAIPLLVGEKQELLDGDFKNSLRQMAVYLQKQCIVVIETSVPIGYCRQQVLPVLEEKGKKHEKDFYLTYSPERIKSGSMLLQLRSVPKVIGGINAAAGEAAKALYASFFPATEVVLTESTEAAELVKLAGMIYRDVNIALSNQLAVYSHAAGIAYADLISLINTDNEANLLYPGIGVGGHCTPVYPYFLIENFKQQGLDFSMGRLGRQINQDMPAYVCALVKDKWKNKKALILGLGFRPDVKEDTLSVTYSLQEQLRKDGIEVWVHDTVFTAAEIEAKGLRPAKDLYATGAEIVFLVTMHHSYRDIDYAKLKSAGVNYMVDGRNSLNRQAATDAGIIVFGIGY